MTPERLAGLDAAVMRLLKALAKEDGPARRDAIERLDALHGRGGLSAVDMQAFANGLWRPLRRTGLPSNEEVTDCFLLVLPQPEDRPAEQAFRRAYLSREVPDPFVVPDAMHDSRRFRELVGRLKAVSYAGHPAAATGVLPITVDAGAAALLTERLIACIARFEPAKGDRFAALDRTGLIRLALGALATTAIPNLADDDVASLEAVDSCLAALRANGLPTLDVRVPLLRLRPEGRDDVEAEMDLHLRSHRISRVEAALYAMLRWAVFGRAWRVPGPPKHLQGSVFLLVANGWPPALRQALDTAVSILKQQSGTSDLPSIRDLMNGLVPRV